MLVFSASLRDESLNTRLANLVSRLAGEQGASVDRGSMREFDCPSYDGDLEAKMFPPGAAELKRRLESCDAFLIASPEYNGSMPGLLKNAIDWVSRYRPQPFPEKQALLLSASPSMIGGNRGLWALRQPLEHLAARVYPDMFSLPQAHRAFDGNGALVNAQLQERLVSTVSAFLALAEAARDYPCMKANWYEFLGERSDDPVVARAQVAATA